MEMIFDAARGGRALDIPLERQLELAGLRDDDVNDEVAGRTFEAPTLVGRSAEDWIERHSLIEPVDKVLGRKRPVAFVAENQPTVALHRRVSARNARRRRQVTGKSRRVVDLAAGSSALDPDLARSLGQRGQPLEARAKVTLSLARPGLVAGLPIEPLLGVVDA